MLELVRARRTADVVELVRGVVRADGVDAAIALLRTVQRDVGLGWQARQLSVADEHAATALVDLALSAALLEGGRPIVAGAPTVVVACVEDEWHVLPARMFAEQVTALGYEVAFLGASMPGEQLREYVAQVRPAAVTLSCSVALHLAGARRSVAACHAAGVPAIVGGAAFGSTPARAVAIGADGWSATAEDVRRLVTEWAAAPPVLATPRVDDAPQRALAALRPGLVDCAMGALAESFRPLTTYTPWQLTKTREDFDYVVRFAEAALLTGDDAVFTEFVAWLSALLTARGLPPEVVPLSLRQLASCVPEDRADVVRLLRLGVETVTARG